MKKTLAAALVAVVAAGGFLGYQKYRAAQFLDAVQPAVKATTIRVGNVIESEIKTSNITFKESFDRSEATIKEIESAMVGIQAMDHTPNVQLAELSLNYMRESVSLVRALTSVNRKLLASRLAHESYRDSITELKSATGYGIDIAARGMERSLDRAKTATQELEESGAAAHLAAESFSKAADQLRPLLDSSAVIAHDMLAELASKYKPARVSKN